MFYSIGGFSGFIELMDTQWRFEEGCWRPVPQEEDFPMWEQYLCKIAKVLKTEGDPEEGNFSIVPELSYSKLLDWNKNNSE